jgi:predicted  nucleic acid-binding Zn-ribbon protein
MKSQELKQENDALRAQVMGLAETLRASDNKIAFLESELQGLFKKYQDLKAELNHYIMLSNTSTKNQNDSRYY